MQEIYDVTQKINLNNASILYLFTGDDSITFEKASQEAKWKKKEISAINKNSTWDLT